MNTQTEVPAVPPQPAISTPQLVASMLKGHDHVSDLVFSPGHAPQVEASGQLIELKFQGLERLLPHTARLRDLMGANEHLKEEDSEQKGSTDLSCDS